MNSRNRLSRRLENILLSRYSLYLVRILAVLGGLAYGSFYVHVAHTSFDFGIMIYVVAVLGGFFGNIGVWLATTKFGRRHRIFTSVALLPTLVVTTPLMKVYHSSLVFVSLVLIAVLIYLLFARRSDDRYLRSAR